MGSPGGTQDFAPAPSPKPTQVLTEFTLFPKLPKELQLLIWEEFKKIQRVFDIGTLTTNILTRGLKHSPCWLEYHFHKLGPNSLSSICKASREVMKNEKRCDWKKLCRVQPNLGNFYFAPGSIFVFESNQLPYFHYYPIDGNVGQRDEIFKATFVKTIAVRTLFTKELKTTAQLCDVLLHGYCTFTPYFSLERLIFIKPAWAEKDYPAKDSRFKRNVDKKLCYLKTVAQNGLKKWGNDTRHYIRYLKEKRNLDLPLSSWWENPKVEIMSEAEFALIC